LVLALSVGLLGCSPRDEILRYQVPRQQPPHRMLGAIIPQGERAWFFKLSGANELVAGEEQRFQDFIKSVRLPPEDAADPSWELPSGWKQLPGSGMRFATIEVATPERPLELSVMPLPLPAESGVLSNVNRWRGQIGLAPLAADELQAQSTAIELEGHTATLVNLVGKLGSSAPMAGPFAGGDLAADSEAAHAAHAAAGMGDPAPTALSYDTPAGWKPGERVITRGGVRVAREAAFVVSEGEQQAEITVTSLPASAGAILPNANRWRSQIGLPPLSTEQLDAEQTSIELGGSDGAYFRFVGPQQAVLGVIATRNGTAWFVKLQGHHDLAVRLQPQFEEFVRSIQF